MIAVEGKLLATGPFKLYGPQHNRPIILIGCVLRCDEEETPVFLLIMMLPQEAHRVDASLYPYLHPSTQLICPARLLRLFSGQLQHKSFHQCLLGFPQPHWPHSRILIKANQMAWNGCTICGPWRPLICEPLKKLCNNLPPLITGL